MNSIFIVIFIIIICIIIVYIIKFICYKYNQNIILPPLFNRQTSLNTFHTPSAPSAPPSPSAPPYIE